jgi:hypothetical protein
MRAFLKKGKVSRPRQRLITPEVLAGERSEAGPGEEIMMEVRSDGLALA